MLGLGVQSTALYYMSSLGILPRADQALFADTGGESSSTYAYLDLLLKWQQDNNGICISVCREKNLYADLVSKNIDERHRFSSIPAFTMNEGGTVGMLRRQCTWEYKIGVVDNHIRDHVYHLPKGARRPTTLVWMGITTDEMERMAFPREAWKVHSYPFLGYTADRRGMVQQIPWAKKMSRKEVEAWYHKQDLPLPEKSSCVFCPYHSDASWAAMKQKSPADFAKAVQVDNAVRNSTSKGIHQPVFLHRSCKPLSEASFSRTDEPPGIECSGQCHV